MVHTWQSEQKLDRESSAYIEPRPERILELIALLKAAHPEGLSMEQIRAAMYGPDDNPKQSMRRGYSSINKFMRDIKYQRRFNKLGVVVAKPVKYCFLETGLQY